MLAASEETHPVPSRQLRQIADRVFVYVLFEDIFSLARLQETEKGLFHTAGNPGRHDLDDTQELYYPAIMRAIAETKYDGYVGQEFSPTDDALAGLEAAYITCDV